nr:integrase core domain-containing protein [Psychromicrobium silvestre]
MEPVTHRWVSVELTIALDLYSRCVPGLRLSPVSTRSADVAAVLFEVISFQKDDRSDKDSGASEQPAWAPSCVPQTIVVDHGKQYLSAHVLGACGRLGINVQPAIPGKPTDKAAVERFFRSLRESLLENLDGYKGPDVYSRGKDVELKGFYYVSELEDLIRQWINDYYHQRPHSGLVVPELPSERFSPSEVWDIGVQKGGVLRIPASNELRYEFLEVKWRAIHHYGVEIDGRTYNGSAVNMYRGSRSSYVGAQAGKWPFFIDSYDIRWVYFRDPDTEEFSSLEWEHAKSLNGPLSAEAAAYAKEVASSGDRRFDPETEMRRLLLEWSRGEVLDRRSKTLARRTAARAEPLVAAPVTSAKRNGKRKSPHAPGAVVDLLTRRVHAETMIENIEAEVFEEYYKDRPEGAGMETLD